MHSKLAGLLGTAFILGAIQVVSAADMSVKAPIMRAISSDPSWTGWYAGLNAGGDWITSQTSTFVSPSTTGLAFNAPAVALLNGLGAPSSASADGFSGGAHGGFNYQLGQWLTGIEVDFESMGGSASRAVSGPGAGAGAIFNAVSSVNTDWLFTARPRLGFITNGWLFYGTGGVAVSSVRANWSFSSANGLPVSFAENASATSTKTGWVAGGGIEKMLPGRWLVGVEYLHVDLGSVSGASSPVTVTAGGGIPLGAAVTNLFSHTADVDANIVRARLTKLF
jgi:outer membrane immunogenic protein